jgi:DnaJ-class molecular chaperone
MSAAVEECGKCYGKGYYNCEACDGSGIRRGGGGQIGLAKIGAEVNNMVCPKCSGKGNGISCHRCKGQGVCAPKMNRESAMR